jgi:hypothetical protein
MDPLIEKFARECGAWNQVYGNRTFMIDEHFDIEKFAELIVRECADICMEMATKCAGLEGDGALAKDCAYWIKKDFGVEL